MESQMKRGVLEMCLLSLIAEKESYGYDLLQKMTAVFPDQPERTIYAILRRLLTNGYTEAFSRQESSGPPRKYYRMTEWGKKYLQEMTADWEELVQAVSYFKREN